ncbi:MAG: VOC family protein [Candidatus Thorarchaeota archaeon]
MAGIVFFRTARLEETIQFYTSRLGMKIWLEQKECTILSHGNLLLGFCQNDAFETEGVITFFSLTRREVDQMHNSLQDIATSEPTENETYRIYQFYARDLEGRTLEFQAFLHSLQPIEIPLYLRTIQT